MERKEKTLVSVYVIIMLYIFLLLVNIKMTLTTPMCPYGPMMVEEVKAVVKELKGVKEANVELSFDPPWQPSKELRATLGV